MLLVSKTWGLFLESRHNFAGPTSYFMCAMFALKTQIESWATKFQVDKTHQADMQAILKKLRQLSIDFVFKI